MKKLQHEESFLRDIPICVQMIISYYKPLLQGVGLSLGVKLELIIDMPSNNKMLVFR